MVDSTLEALRQDAFAKRVKGTGGKHILWSDDQVAELRDAIFSLPEKVFRAAAIQRKFVDHAKETTALQAKLQGDGTISQIDGPAADQLRWVYRISSKTVDLQNDSTFPEGCRADDFARFNPAVLASHNSDQFPIAKSTKPWIVGDSVLAIVTFPNPGVSAASDQARSLVAAGILRGASIGFIPLKFAISKDPSRPLGVDFIEWRLLEFSLVSIPCCPPCVVLGPAGERPPAPVAVPASPPKSLDARERRMAEAAALSRVANWKARA